MKLPPCSTQMRSHSRTGHDSGPGGHRRQGIDPKFFDSWAGNGVLGGAPCRPVGLVYGLTIPLAFRAVETAED